MEKQQQAFTLVPFEVQRAQAFADARTQAMESRLDECDEGGRYLMPDGETEVDANGRILAKEDKGALAGDGLGTHGHTSVEAYGGRSVAMPIQNEGAAPDEATEKRNARLRVAVDRPAPEAVARPGGEPNPDGGAAPAEDAAKRDDRLRKQG